MKNRQPACFVLAPFLAVTAAAQAFDWETVQKIPAGTLVLVVTQQRTLCTLQKATGEQLFCRVTPADSRRAKPVADLVFNRPDVQQVYTGEPLKAETFDYSKGFLALMLAVGGGGGVDSAGQPTSFAGVKIGGPFSLDLQYDRIQGRNGFSTEGSPVLPLFRVPRFNATKDSKFIKVFAEPGWGYR